jgi:hypothetical protein
MASENGGYTMIPPPKMAIARFRKMISGFGDAFTIWTRSNLNCGGMRWQFGGRKGDQEISFWHVSSVKNVTSSSYVGTCWDCQLSVWISVSLSDPQYPGLQRRGSMAFTLDKVGKVLPLFFSGLEPAKKGRVGESVIDPKMEDPPLWQCKKTSKNMLFLILIRSITLSLWRVMFFCSKTMVLSAL